MTQLNQEFEQLFDLLYNNIASNLAPGLDTLEKSIYLTNALYLILIELYRDSFEASEEVRKYLLLLVKLKTLSPKTSVAGYEVYDTTTSKLVDISNINILYTVYEGVVLELTSTIRLKGVVVPVTHDLLFNELDDPFRCPNDYRVLRLDSNLDNIVELISKYPILSYLVRYIEKPSPIILDNLDGEDVPDDTSDEETETTHWEGDTIEGEHLEKECLLHPCLHRLIIQRAVELAKASWKG